MEYINLGESGLKVSRLCPGIMTYGSTEWRPRILNEERARPFVKLPTEETTRLEEHFQPHPVLGQL